MNIQRPGSAEELACLLGDAGRRKLRVRSGGSFSKDSMAGPICESGVTLSSSGLGRILQYEPNDLTISVEAGMPFAELSRELAANRQMIPLDPPFFENATVGGVIASNCSGPRRRGYGTARDLVIGMKFVTLEGKTVQSGGMVVKNVAGLDMGKLLIGSFGTLAFLLSVNFKLTPIPEETRAFVFGFPRARDAYEKRNQILKSVLQPVGLDLLNPEASALAGLAQWSLIAIACGHADVMRRYRSEWPEADEYGEELLKNIREFTPAFLSNNPKGVVVRISSTISALEQCTSGLRVPILARAGNGVAYAYFADGNVTSVPGGVGVFEFASSQFRHENILWPAPGNDFEMMKRVKHMFDPHDLLNRGRLYGRI